MYKRLALTPASDPDEMSVAELLAAHWQLHELYLELPLGKLKGKWTTEDVVNLHARVVDQLFDEGKPHPPPPDTGLDDLSSDFESHSDEQENTWTEPPVDKIEKREMAIINRSGEVQGEVIKVDEILPHFKDFKLRKPYIYLVGGLANHGSTRGDIDVLVSDSDETAPWIRDIVEFRLGRSLPASLSKRLHVHFDRERGPFTNHIELYDLCVERINPDNEVKEMRSDKDEERPANMVESIDELVSFLRNRAAA
jgi:hypothetical protein